MLTVLGIDKTTTDGFRPCIVTIDGSKAYWINRTTPDSVTATTADVQTWMNANVSAPQQAAWKAHADDVLTAVAVVPEGWTRAALGELDVPPYLRAVLKLILDELNTLRALHSLPDRTVPQAITGVLAKLNT